MSNRPLATSTWISHRLPQTQHVPNRIHCSLNHIHPKLFLCLCFLCFINEMTMPQVGQRQTWQSSGIPHVRLVIKFCYFYLLKMSWALPQFHSHHPDLIPHLLLPGWSNILALLWPLTPLFPLLQSPQKTSSSQKCHPLFCPWPYHAPSQNALWSPLHLLILQKCQFFRKPGVLALQARPLPLWTGSPLALRSPF